jgi:divalent metal cation (Fe/Co/Zn/Cd) transporter
VADPAMLSVLTYIAAHHDSRITHVDTVRAYYSGANIIAEVDIVLPRGMPLEEAHNIGDLLQKSLER